eukprot:CAMPEP_0180421144 /NCGR_PEP_ID=MMETSP1036_2-20121128/2998_1 /TAXON_ID=632150 /ORGANISM="Azadinium spinosum, Strain 3D9" /LENGTH=100 /DNA_ID=CAMNT_0022426397 /DNA_START=334 /DNA_END=636 /DNA_ORIENTATION=+
MHNLAHVQPLERVGGQVKAIVLLIRRLLLQEFEKADLIENKDEEGQVAEAHELAPHPVDQLVEELHVLDVAMTILVINMKVVIGSVVKLAISVRIYCTVT